MKKEKPGGGAFPQRLQVLGSASRARWIFRPGLTRNFGGSRKPGAAGRTAEGWGIGDGKKAFLAGWICRGVAKQLVQLCCLLLLSSHPSRLGVNVSLCPCVPASPCPCALASTALPARATLLSLLGKGCCESREHMELDGPTHPAQAWAGPCQQQDEKPALSSNLTPNCAGSF